MDAVVTTIPLTAVTDAKDVYDKGQSDTPSYGSQKSLCFSKAWLRSARADGASVDQRQKYVGGLRRKGYESGACGASWKVADGASSIAPPL